ncbi:hypothetical protein PAMP_008648 [Pampus punctatissimus]
MTHWQILRASKASLVAPGYPLHHGHRVAVHYSTAAEALDGSAASTDKLTMQELNSRLALYLQQVHCLEAANQQLECQILQQLDRKCPGDLQHLDRHLQTLSLLRGQSVCTACCLVKDQLGIPLPADCSQSEEQCIVGQFSMSNQQAALNSGYEKEQEYRGGVEVELKDLKLLGEELMMHKLPELQKLLNSQTQQMMQMQIQHQQNVQGLLAQVSGGIAVNMQVVGSADLKLQLSQRRNVTLFDHDDRFTNQVTTVTFERPAVSEAAMVGLNQLRGTAASMEQELMLLQSQNMHLECFGQQQMESSVEQLEFLQQREDGLCRDLDSALQAVTQQAVNYQDLLDVKNQLENEIQDYRHLLDERGCQWVPNPSFCAPFNTAAFGNKVIQDKMVSFQGGNLNMGGVQTKGYTGTVRQTPVFTPLSVATVQSIRVQDSSPLTSIYTSDLTGSFHKSENQRTEALSDRSERESTMINRWSNRIDYKAHTIDPESFSLKQTNIDVGFKAGTSTNTEVTNNITGADIKQETHFITHTTTTDPCTQTLAKVVKETETAELESYVHTFDQDSAQVASLKLAPQAEMIRDAGDTAFKVSGLLTASSCSVNSNEILVRENLTASADTLRKSMSVNRWSSLLEDKEHTVDPDPLNQLTVGAQISLDVEDRSVVSLKLEPQAEVVMDASEVVVTAFEVSGSEGVQDEVYCESTLKDDKNREEVKTDVESTLLVHGFNQSLFYSNQNNIKEDTDAGFSLPTASSCSSYRNDNLNTESLTASADTLRKSMTMNRWSSLLEDKVQAVDPDPLNQSVVGAQISLSIEDRSGVSLKSEPQAEMIKDASEVTVTAFEVSGLPTASSCNATSNEILVRESLTASADTLRKSMTMNRWSSLLEDKVQAVDPDPLKQSVVGAQISLSIEDRSGVSLKSEPQAEMIKDASEVTVTAFEVSGLPTASSCSATSNEILVRESLTASADTLRKSMTMNRWSSLLEDKVQAVDPDPLKQSVVGAQISLSIEDRSGVSLKSEPQAEMIKDASEVTVTAFEVSGLPTASSCSATSNEILVRESLTASADTLRKSMTMNRWSSLLEDKVQAVDSDPLKQSVVGAQISLSIEDRSGVSLKSEPQAEMIKDASEVTVTAFEVSGLPTASSCSATSNEILVRESLTKSADTLRNSMTMNRWSSLLEDKVQAVDPDPLKQSVVDAQISLGVEDRSVVSLNLEPQAEVVRDASQVVVTAFEVSGSKGFQGEVSSGVMLIDGKNSVKEVADVVLDLPTASSCIANSKDILVKEDITVQSTETLKEVNGFHVTDGVMVASQTDCGVILSSGYAKEPLSITVPVTCPTNDAEMFPSPNDCLSLIGEEDDEIALDLTEASACVRPVEKYVLSTQGESHSVSFSVDQDVLKVDRNRNVYGLVDNKAGDSFGSFPAPRVPSAGTVGVATGAATTSEAQDLVRVLNKESEETLPVATFPATSQPETGRFGKSGQWMVYGGSIGRKSSQDGNVSLPNTESEDSTSVATQLAANPPGTGRFGSTGSGEWRVYGGSTGSFSSSGSTERVRVSTSSCKMSSVPGDKMSEAKLSSSGSVLRRSSSLGSTEKLSSAGSGGKLSSSSGNLISSSGIFTVSGSGHRSSMGSGGRPGRGKTTTRHRTHSPGERRSVSGGSGGWLSGSAAGGNRISSSVSAPKLSSSGSSERINSRGGGRGKGSPRLGRANIAGGRVITSSDGPVRSTGSGTGTNQERISVCKMAALTMSAAGRERSQERQRQAQRSAQQEASASPLIQRWLTSAVDVPMADPDGLDDII